MSFTFKWPQFSDDFHRDARDMLESALNKGNKPPVIADKIEVIELEMGTQPPDLEIRDIGDLTLDQFRGIFRFSYSGDAHIVLRTRVQANPLNHRKPDSNIIGSSFGMLAAHQSLVVPMRLCLSRFVLNAYVVLVVSKQKGITLVFKTDPLQNVDVNSTFDSIVVIQKYIQREIEGQLREMFREDLPGIIHRLSQRWVSGKAKVETSYLYNKQRPRTVSEQQETMSAPDVTATGQYRPSLLPDSHPFRRHHSVSGISSWRQMHGIPSLHSAPSVISTPSFSSLPANRASYEPPTTFPGIEDFDPTYGLRQQDHVHPKSGYKDFGRLFGAPKGLCDLTEEPGEYNTDWNEASSFDMVDWEETAGFTPPPPSVTSEEIPEESSSDGGGVDNSPPNFRSAMDADGSIVLRPGLNNSISHLSTLSHSNHTLSPYTRSLEHFTVRSLPHRASGPTPAHDRQPVKAKRKRTYRLGAKKPPDLEEDSGEQRLTSSSPPPPSEFEASDVEHYFRVPHSGLRRRTSHQDL